MAIGSSSDGVTGGGKTVVISDYCAVMRHSHCVSCLPPAAIGSSSDGITGGGRKI